MNLLEQVQESVADIRSKINISPRIAVILGSGLGGFSEQLRSAVRIPYDTIPHFPVSTVVGHDGALIVGMLGEIPVLLMSGRFHYYEGNSMARIGYPIHVMKGLGIEKIIVTNAAGGINRDYHAGEFMLMKDHIKFFNDTPLTGENEDKLGPRFFDMSNAYDSELRSAAKSVAEKLGILMHEGVYAFMSGPNFETPAEIRMLGILGADAVGMSTVPEVLTAVHDGIRVLGISCITNLAAGISEVPLSHEEVFEAAERIKTDFARLIQTIIEVIA